MATTKPAKKRPAKKTAPKRAAKKTTKAKSAKKVNPIPSRYSSVIPSFGVADCAGAVEFLVTVFGAKVLDRYDDPTGAVMHCELRIGDTTLMCGDAKSGAPVHPLHASIYVKDCDAIVAKAVAKGATIN